MKKLYQNHRDPESICVSEAIRKLIDDTVYSGIRVSILSEDATLLARKRSHSPLTSYDVTKKLSHLPENGIYIIFVEKGNLFRGGLWLDEYED